MKRSTLVVLALAALLIAGGLVSRTNEGGTIAQWIAALHQ
jgi:hypothetical protein